jgi:PBP superfamily domain
MNRTVFLAASIAAALGTGSAFATPPTLAQIEGSTNNVYIAGSSAAKNAVLGALTTNVCGGAGNAFSFNSSGNTNFFAVSCVPVAAANAANGGVYNFFYRDEGGSVVGMLPIVNGKTINQLSLVAGTIGGCSASPCNIAVTGTSSTNGVDDSFGPTGTVAKHAVDIGISDVEPAALTGNNYPTPYSTTVWGPVNQSGLANLAGTQLFGEVYALFVNENSTVFTENPLKLSQQTVQQILTHRIRNWNLVTDVAGNTVTNGSLAITIVNREKGSGSRTATDLLIAGDSCTTGGSALFDAAGATDFFSTGDVLTNASGTPGAITYATIDQSAANMVQVWLNGVQPTNLNAASGAYPFWVESEFVINTASTADANVMNFITSALQAEATAPHVADVLAIPGVPSGAGNVAHAVIPNTISTVPALGAASIYVNPFTRGGVTCSAPTYVATVQ